MLKDNRFITSLIFEEGTGCLDYRGIRYLIVRPETIIEIQRIAEKDIGQKKARLIFYRSGYKGTTLTAKRLLDEGVAHEKVLDSMFAMGAYLGWGKFNIMESDELMGRFTVRVKGSPFAEAYGTSNKPVCHLLSGALAGIFSGAYNKNYQCEEIECVAKGDVFCLFTLQLVES